MKLSNLLCALLFLTLVKIGALAVLGLDSLSVKTHGPANTVILAAVTDQPASAQDKPAAQPPAKPDPKAADKNPPAAPAQPPAEASLNWQMLKQKQEELAAREQSLRALENDLNARLQRLASVEKQVKDLIDQASAMKDEKMKHLIAVYVNMKAKQAAQALEAIDEAIAVKILAGMSGRQAGEILSNVNPKKAARLSEDLTRFQTQ